MIKSNICKNFSNQINNEIAAGEYGADYSQVSQLKRVFIKNTEQLGLPAGGTMYDIFASSIEILPTLRFIYLMSLLEAFAEEYIAERLSIADGGSVKENQKIKDLTAEWQKYNINGSTSFYNISFLNYLFKGLFGVDFSSKIQEETFEAGELRRCIVHSGGRITNKYTDKLSKIITYLGLNVQEEPRIIITKKLMAIFIEDARTILKICDYE